MKKLVMGVTLFFVLFGLFLFLSPLATAQETKAAVEETSKSGFNYVYIACAIGIAIAAFGGALGQGKSVSSALEGIARNPNASGKIQTAMIIGLALIESLVIYALVVVLILLFKYDFMH